METTYINRVTNKRVSVTKVEQNGESVMVHFLPHGAKQELCTGRNNFRKSYFYLKGQRV